MYNWLIEAQILEKRGFSELADEILDKAERLATKYHKHYHLIEILSRKGNLIFKLSTKNIVQDIDETFTKSIDSANSLVLQLNYDYLTNWLYALTAVKRYHTDSDIQYKIKLRIDDIIKNNIPSNKSFYIDYLYYKSWALYHYTQQTPEKAKDAYLKIMETWEQFPEMKKEEQRNYIATISNLIAILITSKEYEPATHYILKLSEISPSSFDEAAYLFQNIYFYKLLVFLNLHQYSNALTFIPEIKEKLPLYQHAMKQSRLLAIYYNISIAYFLSLEYDPALDWLEKIMSITRTDETRKDIQRFARILQLAIYYQLGYADLLENMVRNVYRSKVVQEDLQPFDKLIFKYFNRLQKYPPNSKQAFKELASLKGKLAELPENQQLLTGFDDFNAWLDLLLAPKAAQ